MWQGLWKGIPIGRIIKTSGTLFSCCLCKEQFIFKGNKLHAMSYAKPWGHEVQFYFPRLGFHNIDIICYILYHNAYFFCFSITAGTQVFGSGINSRAIHPLESRSIEAPAQLCWRKYSCRGGREARTVLVGERNWQDSSKLKQSFVHLFSWHPFRLQRGAAQ